MKKYLSILFALVLVVSLCLVTAVPVSANDSEMPYANYKFSDLEEGYYEYGSDNDWSDGWSFLNMMNRTWLSKGDGAKDGPKIPLPGDFDKTIGYAINDAKQVVGYTQDWGTPAPFRPFAWDPPTVLWQADVEQGTTTILAGVAEYEALFPECAGTRLRHFYPQDISNDGSLIVGYGKHAIGFPGDWAAWVWLAGDETNHFLTLPVDEEFTMPCAYLIDETDGTIYGLAKDSDGNWHKVKWTPIVTIEVDIDIKPGSDPNSINLKSKGLVPVAVLTTEGFDASTVDPDTVLFAGASPVRWTMEDVDEDGDMDMLFHFKTQETGISTGDTEATLTGETIWGNPIVGTDTVNIVPKGK